MVHTTNLPLGPQNSQELNVHVFTKLNYVILTKYIDKGIYTIFTNKILISHSYWYNTDCKGYVALSLFHQIYLCLNESRLGALLTDSGRLFHILGPE